MTSRSPLTPQAFTEPPIAAPAGLLTIVSPLGRIALHGDTEVVTRLEISVDGQLTSDGQPDFPTPVLHQAAAELDEYFAGSRTVFTVPVRLSGTVFQQAVWHELSTIPFGTFRGYGELGRATGRATAGRAVGGAVGANPVPLLVPCHRVLASNARITGYSAGDGIATKIWLLDHEGITHR